MGWRSFASGVTRGCLAGTSTVRGLFCRRGVACLDSSVQGLKKVFSDCRKSRKVKKKKVRKKRKRLEKSRDVRFLVLKKERKRRRDVLEITPDTRIESKKHEPASPPSVYLVLLRRLMSLRLMLMVPWLGYLPHVGSVRQNKSQGSPGLNARVFVSNQGKHHREAMSMHPLRGRLTGSSP